MVGWYGLDVVFEELMECSGVGRVWCEFQETRCGMVSWGMVGCVMDIVNGVGWIVERTLSDTVMYRGTFVCRELTDQIRDVRHDPHETCNSVTCTLSHDRIFNGTMHPLPDASSTPLSPNTSNQLHPPPQNPFPNRTPPNNKHIPLPHPKLHIRPLHPHHLPVHQRPHKHRIIHIWHLDHTAPSRRIIQSLQRSWKLRQERGVVVRLEQRLMRV